MNGTELAPSLSQAQFLRVALDVLSRRALRWSALLMAFALFGYAAWRPDVWRLAAATVFTILCYLPLWLKRDDQGS